MGYYVVRHNSEITPDIKDEKFWKLYDECRPYTMTSVQMMYGLYSAMQYVIKNDIQGDFVECGVWKGGSSLLIAKCLKLHGITDRKIYMYDTYEGMPPPTEHDKDFTGTTAEEQLEGASIEHQASVWCYSSFDEVKENMAQAGFPADQIIMVKGKVEDTIPETIPQGNLALLRLDTDWYESTYHELKYLYPKLNPNGILILDDYGHWAGARKAVDEYFEQEKINVMLNRIDYSGRVAIKTADMA